MQLVREGTALQIELLGAAARVWSEIVDRVANYNRDLTNEMILFTGGRGNANQALDRLIEAGQGYVNELKKVPATLGQDFVRRVDRRARPRVRQGHSR
jgi:hypothetical protein